MKSHIKTEIDSFKNKKKIYYSSFSEELVSFLQKKYPDISIQEQFYLVSNNLERKKCEYPECDNFALFNNKAKIYMKGCSKNHSTKLAMIEKYGVENPSQIKEFRDKATNTMINKFGGWGNSSIELNRKHKKTVKEKYNVDNISQIEYVKDKKKQIFDEKYGGIGNASSVIFEKQKQTNLEKYGKENIFSTEYGKNKIKKTNLEKYGVDNINKNKKLKELSIEKLKVTKFNSVIERISQYVIPLFKYEDYKGVDYKNKYNWKCNQCNNIFDYNIDNGIIPRCPFCFPKESGRSFQENELFEKIGIDNKIQSDKSILNGKELDIYIPDKNLAIEFNGLYWHSELRGREKYYHIDKTKQCEIKGIELIQIFENEWIYKKDIVLSFINSKLNIFNNVIDATICEIKEVSYEEKKEFIYENNIFELYDGCINLALILNNIIIAIMSFDKLYDSNFKFNTLCIKNGYKIVNINHFFSYFIDLYNPNSIVVYDNKRYSNKKLYESFGFILINEIEPVYWYFGKGINGIEHAYNWNKDILKNKIEDFNPLLSEWENMKLNGYNRIWDCGQNILEWKK